MKASVRRQLDRRTFFKSAGAAAAGASAIGLLGDAELEGAVQNVNRSSIPSELKITDLRVATTCEGPLLFSIRISPPKPTDRILTVAGRKVYVSAVQAPYIQAIDASMLPRCALEKKSAGR